jgi:hypothetical protein
MRHYLVVAAGSLLNVVGEVLRERAYYLVFTEEEMAVR